MTVGYDLPGQRALDATLHQIRSAVVASSSPDAAALTAASAGLVKYYGALETSVAAGNIRITLENPTASGYKLTLIGLSVASTVTGFGELRVGPTAGLPASAACVAMNALVGAGAAGVAVVKLDDDAVTPLSGGTATGIRFAAGANIPREIVLPAPLILTQGVKLGIAMNLASAYTFAARFTFLEEPV